MNKAKVMRCARRPDLFSAFRVTQEFIDGKEACPEGFNYDEFIFHPAQPAEGKVPEQIPWCQIVKGMPVPINMVIGNPLQYWPPLSELHFNPYPGDWIVKMTDDSLLVLSEETFERLFMQQY